ncbi:MAG: tRNA (adenosine(37)-N6)-threonylcarbamoyltransferase complex ATPase subunit type 1 TsaE [Acidobacteriota bacterium]
MTRSRPHGESARTVRHGHRARCATADETRRLGRRLAAELSPGDVVLLFGALGAGKTCLVQGIAAGLGLDPRHIHSPSFIMVSRHEGAVSLDHVDLYRLGDGESLADLGLEDILADTSITVIEWAERLPDAVCPPPRVEVRITATEAGTRAIAIDTVT